jgi:putative nucleotidyltransferase with HDIG domain
LTISALFKEKNMAQSTLTRQQAFELLTEYNKTEGLIKHALAVEAVMRYFAQKLEQDTEKWGIIGLLHDLDYERFPDLHCHKTAEILRENNFPEEDIHAVMSHGWGLCTDIEPNCQMDKVLYAIDELTGLIAAAALVRPSKSILDIKAKSVKKKFKDKAFAAKIDRHVITKGAEMLGMEMSELMTDTIMAMRNVAEQIGLKGEIATPE